MAASNLTGRGGKKEREKHHFGSCYTRKADGGKQREEVANKRGGCVRGRWQPAEEPLPACDTRRFQNHHLTFPRSASALSPPSSLNRSVTQLYSLPPPLLPRVFLFPLSLSLAIFPSSKPFVLSKTNLLSDLLSARAHANGALYRREPKCVIMARARVLLFFFFRLFGFFCLLEEKQKKVRVPWDPA